MAKKRFENSEEKSQEQWKLEKRRNITAEKKLEAALQEIQNHGYGDLEDVESLVRIAHKLVKDHNSKISRKIGQVVNTPVKASN